MNNKETIDFHSQPVEQIKIGAIYKHYSGKLYKVIAVARDSEDPLCMRVVYQALYDCPTFGPHHIWVRPAIMFVEHVLINDIKRPRFELVETKK